MSYSLKNNQQNHTGAFLYLVQVGSFDCLFSYLIIISLSPPFQNGHIFSLRFATNINHKFIEHRMEWKSVLYITSSCSRGMTAFYATYHVYRHFCLHILKAIKNQKFRRSGKVGGREEGTKGGRKETRERQGGGEEKLGRH